MSTFVDDYACRAVKYTELVLIDALIKIDLPLESILFFTVPCGFTDRIHKDTNLDIPANSFKCALNVPLNNCDGLVMNWYKSTPASIESVYPGPSEMNTTPQLDGGEIIDSVILNSPHVVKIDDWHAVTNHNPGVASLISLRFSKELTIEDILSAL